MTAITTILQARTGSSRLPGKVLMDLLGLPMLARQVERLRRAEHLGRLVIATSDAPADDALQSLAMKIGVECVRGPLDDVLRRYAIAAEKFPSDHVVRVTGDCPLADPDVFDLVVARHLETGADYTSNTIPPTYPDGLDVEVVKAPLLMEADRLADRPSEREHVTMYFKNRPARFRLQNVVADTDLSAQRWTVDEPQDFRFVEAVYARLYPVDPAFGWNDVRALLDREPGIANLNAGQERDAGLKKSLANEAAEAARNP
jgi:spore coat polysaccharide biosynthesis protein SpsF